MSRIREELEIADESVQQAKAVEITNDLHSQGFTNVWIDSVMVFSGGLAAGQQAGQQVKHFKFRVVVADGEVPPDRFEQVLATAQRHGGRLALASLRTGGQQEFSRLTIWPD